MIPIKETDTIFATNSSARTIVAAYPPDLALAGAQAQAGDGEDHDFNYRDRCPGQHQWRQPADRSRDEKRRHPDQAEHRRDEAGKPAHLRGAQGAILRCQIDIP